MGFTKEEDEKSEYLALRDQFEDLLKGIDHMDMTLTEMRKRIEITLEEM